MKEVNYCVGGVQKLNDGWKKKCEQTNMTKKIQQ